MQVIQGTTGGAERNVASGALRLGAERGHPGARISERGRLDAFIS